MAMDKAFNQITIGELVEIKKILKMTVKEGLPAMRKLRDDNGFTDMQTKNLIGVAKSLDCRMMLRRLKKP